jgi:hypothetical protein
VTAGARPPSSRRRAVSLAGIAALVLVAASAADSPAPMRAASPVVRAQTLRFALRSAAFPDDAGPSVAVHIPQWFDAARHPGGVVYFHGWNGCVEVALGDEDAPCTDDGISRHASRLSAQLDDARVNALLVAVELRADMPRGEPGALAMPGGLRNLLRELFLEHLAEPLGVLVDVDDLDPVVIVAHSGGYQAAAGAFRLGDVAHASELVLLDAFYGGDAIFLDALRDPSVRFLDLYTCCGGTLERSRAAALLAHDARGAHAGDVYDDDTDAPLPDAAPLRHGAVFKRVADAHGELPRTYMRSVLETAGFRVVPP